MPLYAYKCATCGSEHEQHNTVSNRASGPTCCGAATDKLLTACMVQVPGGTDVNYECPMTGEHVQSMRRRKYLMQQNGVIDARDLKDQWARKIAKDRADKADSDAYYSSLPDAVKKAAAEIVSPAMA